MTWGLFEDSPEKLRQDVEAARQKHDKEESVKLLADARRLMQQGALRGRPARRLPRPEAARRLQRLGLRRPAQTRCWPTSRRPASRARVRRRSRPSPPSPAVAVNTKPDDKHPAAPPAPKPNDVRVAVSKAGRAGDAARRRSRRRSRAARAGRRHCRRSRGWPPGRARTPTRRPRRRTRTGRKADQLLAEVGRLERENKLLDAHQKALEAVQLQGDVRPQRGVAGLRGAAVRLPRPPRDHPTHGTTPRRRSTTAKATR